VTTYDESEWREILPTMNEKANLSSREASDLLDYLLTVSKSLE